MTPTNKALALSLLQTRPMAELAVLEKAMSDDPAFKDGHRWEMPHRRFYKLVDHEVVPVADHEAWIQWFVTEGQGFPSVARDAVGRGYAVSTIFLGIDTNVYTALPPRVFETQVFREDGATGETWRWATWEAAERGHRQVCDRLKAEMASEPLGMRNNGNESTGPSDPGS